MTDITFLITIYADIEVIFIKYSILYGIYF